MVSIKLTTAEMLLAGQVGVMRSVRHRLKGTEHRHGADGGFYGWGMDLLGALGEAAVAKWSGIWWSGMGMGTEAGDVGPLEVRCVESVKRRLILHPDDKDHAPYILVCAEPPNFTLMGWMLGREGKRKEYWADPQGTNRHAYFVPNDCLNTMQQLEKSEWI